MLTRHTSLTKPIIIKDIPENLIIAPTLSIRKILYETLKKHNLNQDKKSQVKQKTTLADCFQVYCSDEICITGPVFGTSAISIVCSSFFYSGIKKAVFLGVGGGLNSNNNTSIGDIITGYLSYASKQIEKGHLANSVIYTITDINAKEGDSSAKEIQFTSKKLEELKKKGVQGIPEASDFKTTYYQLSRDDSFNFEDLNQNDFDKNNRTVSSLFRKLHNDYKSLLPLKGRNYTAWLETLEEFKNIISKLDLGNTYIYNPNSDKMEKFSRNKHRNLKFQFPHLFIEKGADYGHAITAHKSQGSTYDNVFVDANSFNSIPKTSIMEDGKQINTKKQAVAYVALSRNSKKLHVYEGKTNFKNVKVNDNTTNTPDLSPLDVSNDMTKSKLQAQQDLDNAINDPCNK